MDSSLSYFSSHVIFVFCTDAKLHSMVVHQLPVTPHQVTMKIDLKDARLKAWQKPGTGEMVCIIVIKTLEWNTLKS